MISSTVLFDLIKKLTKSEKRYFTMNAKFQEGSKVYMTLFREIDSLAVYDEVELKKRLQVHGVKVAQLAVIKVQLTKLILKSLRAFHESKSPATQILSLIAEAEILRTKGLYSLALKYLEKAKTIAEHYELHFYIFEILNQMAFIQIGMFGSGTAERMNELNKAMHSLKIKAFREIGIKALAYKSAITLFSKSFKHPSTIDAVKEMEADDLLAQINNDDSFYAKSYFFHAKSQLCRIKGDHQTASQHHKKILEIWDKHPHIRDANPRLYKVYIANYLNGLHLLENYKYYDEWLTKFESFSDTNFDEEAGSFKDFYHITLLYLLNTQQLERALKLVPKIEEGLEKYKSKINKARETTLRYNTFLVCFFNEKFSIALDCLEAMDLGAKLDAKADSRALARIMRVIVHYELGHNRILDDLRTSVYRKLKKQEQLHLFERTILDHIRLIEQVVSKNAKRALFEDLVVKLNGIREAKGMNNVIGLEEILCWAISRRDYLPYTKVLKDKSKR